MDRSTPAHRADASTAEPQALATVARDGLWSVLAYTANAASVFVVSVMVARALGPAEWGRFSLHLWIIRMGPALLALGVPVALAKFVAEKMATGDDAEARALFRLSVKAHAATVAAATIVAGSWLAARDGVAAGELAVLVGIPVALLAMDAEAMMAGLRRFRAIGVLTAATGAAHLAAAATGLALGVGWQGFLSLFVAVLGANLVATLLVCRHGVRAASVVRADRRTSSAFIRYAGICALWLVVENVLWGRPELWFLDRYGSDADVGYYSTALRVASLAALLPLVAARPLVPEFARQRGRTATSELGALFSRVCGLLAVATAPLALIGGAVGGAAIEVVYGAEFAPAGRAAAILMASSLVTAVASPVAAALLTAPRPRVVVELGVACTALNLVLDIVLIPRFGLTGAAVVNVAAQGVWVTVGIIYCRRSLGLEYPVRTLARVVGLAATAAVPAIVVTSLAGGVGGLIAAGAVGLATYVALIWGTGTVDGDDVVALIGPRRAVAGALA